MAGEYTRDPKGSIVPGAWAICYDYIESPVVYATGPGPVPLDVTDMVCVTIQRDKSS